MNKKRRSIDINSTLKEVEVKIENGVFIYGKPISLGLLCEKLEIDVNKFIKKSFLEGKLWTINTFLKEEEVAEICFENNIDFKKEKEINTENFLENINNSIKKEDNTKRPPIITIMGHVDHGKTTLLDTIRKTNIAENEAGLITQHIGAYQITHNHKKITFLDTPGHEAFIEMRSRGASVTDIIIIVVSAVDGVKPQTIEAKDLAIRAELPVIVAINKCDLPNANPEAIMKELSGHDLVSEKYGGNTIFKNISAKTGEGIDDLLETILFVSDVNDYKASEEIFGFGNVLESHIDKSLGVVATLLIKTGVLRVKDPIIAGHTFGKIRAMLDHNGNKILEAKPSTPVIVTGLQNVPNVGDKFMGFQNEKEARKLAQERLKRNVVGKRMHSRGKTMNDLSREIEESKLKHLKLILKTNVMGSIQAIKELINKIEVKNTKVSIVKSSIGVVNESDILLAKTSGAEIITFNLRPNALIRKKAKQEGVEINSFNIIYKIYDNISRKLMGMLDSEFKEEIVGEGKVIAVFKVSKIGTIAGTKIETGIAKNSSLVRVVRNGGQIYDGKIKSLKVENNDVKEVKNGTEVGVLLYNFQDVKVDDVLEFYTKEEIKNEY